MASRKHHKQDSTRPTKARERRLRDHLGQVGEEIDGERPAATATASNGEG
jgi:hypothetical protein